MTSEQEIPKVPSSRPPTHPATRSSVTPWPCHSEQLRREHLSKGMPGDLANVLTLAGQADVRMLVFDADAPVLEGLPLYEA